MKQIKIVIGLVVLAVVLGLGSIAVVGVGLPGSGVSKTENREVGDFDRISMEEIGTLNVTIGDTASVAITTDDNLLEYIETTVDDDGRLKIRNSEMLNPDVGLVVDVVVPDLTSVEIAGAVTLNLFDYEGESLDLELNGACGVTAFGTVRRLDIELNGACRASLKKLESENANVEINGTGSAEVFASKSIDAEASGFAGITCYGNPEDVEKEANGISRVTIEK